MINLNLLDEWNLMKVNIRDLKVNQRLLNFPYFIGVLALTFEMLGINLFFILGIVKSLKYKFNENSDTFVFSSNYTFAHGIFFILTIIVNIIIFYAFSELIKRRLNDYFDSNVGRYAQYIVFAFNLVLLLQWGIQQSITLIDLESTLHLYVYFFYECIAFFALVLLPSSEDKNSHGLPKGMQRSGDYAITYGTIYPEGDKYTDFWDRIGLSYALDSSKSMFIDKLFDYRTRSKRQELYWGVFAFELISTLLNQILFFMYDIFFNDETAFWVSLIFYWIYWGWYILADLSCSVRRLHDTGRSGYWLLGAIIPIINVYIMYLLMFKPSIECVSACTEDISR